MWPLLLVRRTLCAINRKIRSSICRLSWPASRKLSLVILTAKSLLYNHHLDWAYALDTALEPLFWFVDHFTSALGPIFVGLVCITLFVYVAIAYAIGLPYWLERSYLVTCIALIIGNWILTNMIFHYCMALTTGPGSPPDRILLKQVSSMCKKCVAPKPPRAHHCSVCDRCILKMDHHCPWINNCVGHQNHRYFFFFCLYTWFGTIFVALFGAAIAYDEYFGPNGIHANFWSSNNTTESLTSSPMNEATEETTTKESSTPSYSAWSSVRHGCIVFEMLSTAGIFAAIGALTAWHVKLISSGETCVETFINSKERTRLRSMGQEFRNPYDLTFRTNWIRFLGLDQPGIRLIHLLIPVKITPRGDGLLWESTYGHLMSD